MKLENKKIFSILAVIVLLTIMAGIQISFINPSFIKLNLFLVLVLYSVLVKKNIQAIIFAWFGGILTGVNSFPNFGINSLVLLIIAAILIILGKTIFINLTTKSIILIGIIGVCLYHFLTLVLTGGENLSYFLNSSFLMELILTPMILRIFLRNKIRNVKENI